MITCDQQKVVEFTHLISKEGENNKGFEKHVFWKVLKLKTFNESISCNVADFFLLKENSNQNWALKGHSKVTQRASEGQSNGTWADKALSH